MHYVMTTENLNGIRPYKHVMKYAEVKTDTQIYSIYSITYSDLSSNRPISMRPREVNNTYFVIVIVVVIINITIVVFFLNDGQLRNCVCVCVLSLWMVRGPFADIDLPNVWHG